MVIFERSGIVVKFGKWIAKHRILIIIIGIILLIPSAIGFITTRVNYDILSYLPKDIETMKGQDILMEDFGKGGFSMVMIEGMSDKDVVETKKKIVDGKEVIIRKPRKCDTYSKEAGLAMAIVKKRAGNNGNYNNIFRKFIPEMAEEEKAAKKAKKAQKAEK